MTASCQSFSLFQAFSSSAITIATSDWRSTADSHQTWTFVGADTSDLTSQRLEEEIHLDFIGSVVLKTVHDTRTLRVHQSAWIWFMDVCLFVYRLLRNAMGTQQETAVCCLTLCLSHCLWWLFTLLQMITACLSFLLRVVLFFILWIESIISRNVSSAERLQRKWLLPLR